MKINISDEVLAEIGKITVVFGLIEDSLAAIIGSIVTVGSRPRELGMIVTAELSFRQRIDALSSLLLFCLGKENEYVAQFEHIRRLLSHAQEERNKVVHSVWAKQFCSGDAHAVIRMKSTAKQKRGLRTDFISMGLEDLRQLTESVGEAYGKLCLFELYFQEKPENDGSPDNIEMDEIHTTDQADPGPTS